MGDLILLTREQILGATALRSEVVEIPEWGGVVRVREMTAGEQEAYTALLKDEKGGLDLRDYRAKLLSCTVCDGSGALLFTPGDVAALSGLAADPLERLWKAAARLSHLVPGDLEALGKGLAAPSGASSSVSPSSSGEPSGSLSAG